MHDFKLISCDNPTSAGADFVGRVARFSYDGSRFYFSSLYSSTVKSIVNIDSQLVVQTNNTLYTFEPELVDRPLNEVEALMAFL